MLKKYPLTSFVVLAYGITWITILPLILTGIRELEVLTVIGLFGPALGAYFVTRARDTAPKTPRNPVYWWVFVAVWLVGTLVYSYHSHLNSGIPMMMAAAVLAVPSLLLAWMCANAFSRRPAISKFYRSLVIPKGPFGVYLFVLLYFPITHYMLTFIGENGPHLNPVQQTGLPVFVWGALVFVKILFFTGGVNEEPGWRGLLLNGLLEKFNPLLATLILWVIWAVWHFPMELGPLSGMSTAQVAMKWIMMLAPTVMFTWAFVMSRGSILACVLLHASMNLTSEFIPITTQANVLNAVVAAGLLLQLYMAGKWSRTGEAKAL